MQAMEEKVFVLPVAEVGRSFAERAIDLLHDSSNIDRVRCHSPMVFDRYLDAEPAPVVSHLFIRFDSVTEVLRQSIVPGIAGDIAKEPWFGSRRAFERARLSRGRRGYRRATGVYAHRLGAKDRSSIEPLLRHLHACFTPLRIGFADVTWGIIRYVMATRSCGYLLVRHLLQPLPPGFTGGIEFCNGMGS